MQSRLKYHAFILMLMASLSAHSSNKTCYEFTSAQAADIILHAFHEIESLGINLKDMSIISACKKETTYSENHHRFFQELDTYVFNLSTSDNNKISITIKKITRIGNTIKVSYSASLTSSF